MTQQYKEDNNLIKSKKRKSSEKNEMEQMNKALEGIVAIREETEKSVDESETFDVFNNNYEESSRPLTAEA